VTDTSGFEHLRKLLGDLAGKRVLELGCGATSGSTTTTVALASAGATVIALDADPTRVDEARALATAAEVRVECRVGDLADLAFLRADSVDAVTSAGALAGLAELDRLFRQVQRVLRPGAPFAFTLPHPAALVVDKEEEPAGALPFAQPFLARSYFDASPIGAEGDVVHPHTIAAVFTSLVRAGFRVDVIAEPEPPRTARGPALVPDLVVWRARKEGA
jgi:cyclopropane fatty-acyl-phospholipid synthase-like methyltransferase